MKSKLRIISKKKSMPHIKSNKFVVTCAQNNTPVHPLFWQSLLRYCEDTKAQLIVSGITYNTSGFQDLTKDHEDVWFAKDVERFLVNDEVLLSGYSDKGTAQGLRLCADMDILPTAALPLSGMDSYTQGDSIIIPHVKMQLKSVASLTKGEPYMMYTTGTVTLPNYIQRKAGQKAEFHHVIGALVVEFNEDNEWFVRQIISDADGRFQDIDKIYTPYETTQGDVSIVLGDLHATQLTKEERTSMYGMLIALRPIAVCVHDVLDFYSRNHHSINNPLHRIGTLQQDVINEIITTRDTLNIISASTKSVLCVQSNHDEALIRWLCEADYRDDYQNATTMLKMQAKLHDAHKYHPLEFALKALNLSGCQKHVQFLRRDSIEYINGILISLHGDKGANGSKGTPRQLSKLGYRTITGHTHSAEIIDGAYVVGTCGLEMDYAKDSPSSWSRTHCLIYETGKRSLITMRNSGKWRA